MLSKFFPALKPKEYTVQILKDNTSQSAVKRIKRTRTSSPLKKIASLALVLSFIGGGLVSATAATAVTAEQAQANIFADMVCIKSGDDSGAWNGGANVYGPIGGRAQYSMDIVGKRTVPSDAAYGGKAGDWGSNAPDGGKFLTAYEKYGMLYPVYDSWVPVYTEKEDKITVKQVDSHASTGTYATADGKLTTKGDGNELEAGSSPLTTSDIGACLAFMPAVSAGISNMIAVLPRFVMGASIELYSTAYGSSLSQPDSVLYGLGKAIDKFITQSGGLKDTLFIGFMMPLLMIGAIIVGWAGIVKKKTTEALQSTLWMVLAIAFGSVFLAQPSLISSYIDDGVYQVQRVVNGSVLDGSQSNDMCNLTGSNDSKKVLRETKCTLWHSTIYSTWVAGQFGDGANSSRGGGSVLTQEADRDILGNGLYTIQYGSDQANWKTAQTWPQFMVDRQVTNKSLELSEVAWAQLSGTGGAKINSDWAGSIGMISSAILMFFGAGASSAVLFVYGFALLVYQLMMISAVLMSPFFFLFGIIPNWGRRVLMRYAELLVSLAVKRIVTGTLLAFYLLFYNLVIGDAAVDMLLLKIIVIFALAIFFIGQRAKFVNMFAGNINFGGDKSIGLPGNKAIALTAGLGVGLLGGGIIGGAIATSKVRKSNKEMEGDIKNMSLAGSPTADIKNPPRGASSGGDKGSGASPLQTINKTVGTVKDVASLKDKATDAKKFLDGKGASQGASQAPSGGIPTNTPPVAPQGMSAASGSASGGASSAGSASAGTAASSGAATAGAGAKATGLAGRMAAGSSGGAGAAVAPAGAAAATGVSSAGAAAGSAGVAAGGAAAAGSAGIAAGGAAAAGGAGAVAAGAAAGSVVPVVGTAVGAAAAAIAVSAAAKKKKAAENGGE